APGGFLEVFEDAGSQTGFVTKTVSVGRVVRGALPLISEGGGIFRLSPPPLRNRIGGLRPASTSRGCDATRTEARPRARGTRAGRSGRADENLVPGAWAPGDSGQHPVSGPDCYGPSEGTGSLPSRARGGGGRRLAKSHAEGDSPRALR